MRPSRNEPPICFRAAFVAEVRGGVTEPTAVSLMDGRKNSRSLFSLTIHSLTDSLMYASEPDNQRRTKLPQSQKPGESPDGAVRVLNESFETLTSFQTYASHDLLVSVLSISDMNGSLTANESPKSSQE